MLGVLSICVSCMSAFCFLLVYMVRSLMWSICLAARSLWLVVLGFIVSSWFASLHTCVLAVRGFMGQYDRHPLAARFECVLTQSVHNIVCSKKIIHLFGNDAGFSADGLARFTRVQAVLLS